MKNALTIYGKFVFIFLFIFGSTLLLTQQLSAQTCVPGTFTTIGNASVLPSNELQLTPDDYGQRGGIWSNNKADLSQPFDFTVLAYLGSNDIGGADGLCFVLQDAPGGITAIGESGRGIGAGDGDDGTGGLNPSFIFEIDTWQNNNMGWNDPPEDHLTAYINGDGRHAGLPNTIMNPVTIANIEDNAYHPFRVTWDPSTKLIVVYLDGVEKASATFDLISYFGGTAVYWGYTAATGASKNRHAVCPQGTLDATITATNDKYFGVNGITGGVVGNVLTNDKVNFVQATTSNVILTLKTADPTGHVTLNTATGAVTVAPGTPAAAYTLEYQICQTSAPTNCTYALVFVDTRQPGTISITPLNVWVQQGVNNCWTANVKDASNNPLTNMKVNFAVTGSHSPSPGYAYTDANGNATWCYPGYYPEFPNYTNTITATLDGFPLLSTSTGVTWYIWSLSSITLTPNTGTSPTRIENCWQALVMDGGYSGSGHTEPPKPLPSQSVKFTVSGPNGSIIPAYTTTSNSSGVAYFCYAGLKSGQDYIQAKSPATGSGTGSNYVDFTWTGTKYPVTYSVNGGNGSPPDDYNSPYDPGVMVTVQNSYGNVWRTGYTLGGWNMQSNGSGTTYAEGGTFEMPANAVVLYAKWDPITYTVTYNGNGNTGGNVPVDPSSPYAYQTTVTVLGNTGTPPLEKTPSWFGGWNTMPDYSGTTYQAGNQFTITGNTTLYAIWLSSPNPVTYFGNGNTGGNVPVDGSSPYAYQATVTVLGNVGTPAPLVKSGYVFNGWNTQSNGSGTTYQAGNQFVMPGLPVNLYARWAPAYSVYYYGNGQTSGIPPSDPNGYASNATVTVLGNTGTPPLQKTNYIFAGWWTGCGSYCYPMYQAGQTFQITGNTSLYARWVSNTPHHVYYNANGGSGTVPLDNNTYVYGTSVTILGNTGIPPLTKPGYVFNGWHYGSSSGFVVQPNTNFTMGEGDVTFYANWDVANPVTYYANGGTGNVPVDPNSPYPPAATVTVLGNVGTPVPLTWTGYTFVGWNTQANGAGITYLAGATFPMPASAVILYAKWDPILYQVTYLGNGATGGNPPMDPNSPYAAAANVTVLGNIGSPTLEKTGYIFGGWNTQAGGSGTTYAAGATFSMPASDVSLYAKWNLPVTTYPLTYDANGATGGNAPVDPNSPYAVAATVTVLGNIGSPTLGKTGYIFGGWNTQPGGSGTTYAAGATFSMPANAVTLYANWLPTSTITFDTQGGNLINPITQVEGSAVTRPPDPTKAGFTFLGWVPDVPATMPVDDVTCVAQWQAIPNPQSTITFDSQGGTPVAPITQDEGTPVTDPADPTKAGFTFLGWVPAVPATMPVDDMTCVAQWEPYTFPVTYNANGGSGNVPVDANSPYAAEATVTVLGNVGVPALTRSGYIFGGWNTMASGSGTTYAAGATFSMSASAVTLYAIWLPTSTITFDTQGGNLIAPITQVENTVVTAPPDPTKAGFTFLGWVPAVPETMPEDDITCVAQWEEITYGITYHANGGSGNVPVDLNSPYTVGAFVTVLGNVGVPALTRIGYSFGGWNTQANGSGNSYQEGATFNMPSSAVILYAIWTEIKPVVTAYPVNITCFGYNNGAVNIDVSSGTPPYTYSWSNTATTRNISGLSAGVYSVTVTDHVGFTATDQTTVYEPLAAVSCAAVQTNAVSCKGGADGEAVVTPDGGWGSYLYRWNNDQTTSIATGLLSGTYTVTVTDLAGCTSTCEATIMEPQLPLSCNINHTNVQCFGASTGNATAIGSGGTPDYIYLWSTNQTTATISGLSSGAYTVTVTDNNGCKAMNSVEIFQPSEPLAITNCTKTDVLCFGTSTGSVSAGLVTGSIGTTSYTWKNSLDAVVGTTPTVTNLPAGTYTLTISDNCSSAGCSATIGEPADLTASCSHTDAICTITNAGSAIVAANGGVGNYFYLWSNGGTTTQITGLSDGTYSVTVSDGNGCTETSSTIVTVNLAPQLVTHHQSACSPNKVNLTLSAVTAGSTLNGATLTYWMNSAATIQLTTPTSVGTGTYYIKAATLTGCYDIKPVTVSINPLPIIYPGTGGGSYCAGGSGLVIGIAGSQVGVNYIAWIGITQVSPIVPGTGGPISFGVQTVAGIYWILAQNVTTGCTNHMYNCVHITIDPLLPVSVTIKPAANPVTAGSAVTFTATPVNEGPAPTYQWRVNGFNAGTNLGTFTYVPVNHDEVTCVLTSNLPCISGNPATSNVVVMNVNGVPANITVTGNVAEGQTKCYNATDTLTIAGNGTTFIVNPAGSAIMIAGKNIHYLAGFTAQLGSLMHGFISDTYCGQKAPAITATTEGEDELPVAEQKASFKLYPNPTSGNFTLEQTGDKLYDKVSVEVYGMRGERIMTDELVRERKHEFWLSDLPHGLYFVKVVAKGNVETFKLVKTR